MRRLCVLRERGEVAAADTLEAGPLAELTATLRATAVAPAEFDQQLEAVFTTEQERVANASALAELLLPLLSNGSPLFGLVASTPPTAAPASAPAPASFTQPAPPVRRAPGDIADFLDDMIAQDEAESAPSVSRRRAS